MRFKTPFSLILTGVLLLPAQLWPQEVTGPKSGLVQGAATGGLKVIAVQGEGAINNTRSKNATQPVVEVRDEQDKPVAGAEVVFQLPAAGPGGVFNGWMRTQTARTDAEGRASATGLSPNDEEGRFNIKVTATEGKRTGTVIIAQSNSRTAGGGAAAKSGKSHKTLWILVGIGAAAAIGGGVAASRGGSESTGSTTTPVTITPGAVTVAGPR